MDRKFILSCCSTVDLPYSYMQSRDIPVLFYTYVVDGQEYVDDMGRDPEALPRFYRFLEAGKLPQTSQINVGTYLDFFEAQLEKGDLLHIAFTSGQAGSVHNAVAAARLLQVRSRAGKPPTPLPSRMGKPRAPQVSNRVARPPTPPVRSRVEVRPSLRWAITPAAQAAPPIPDNRAATLRPAAAWARRIAAASSRSTAVTWWSTPSAMPSTATATSR